MHRKYNLPNSVIIYGYLHIDHVWKTFGSFGLIAFILLLVAVGIIVIVSLLGTCGAICRDRCCLIFYALFILILCGVMTAVGVVAIVLPPNYFSTDNDSKCLKISAFHKLQNFSEAARKSVCSTCDCYFPNSNNTSVYTPQRTSLPKLEIKQL